MKNKLLVILSIIIFNLMIFCTNVQAAATFGLKASKSEITVGESYSVTISGIYGKVTISGSNTTVSPSGSQFVDGSLTVNCTSSKEGTAKVTVTAHEAATTGLNPQEVSETKSVSVKVKAKEQPKPQTPQTQTTTTSKPVTQTTTKKETTKKKETKKAEVIPTEEKEEATPEWGISEIKVVGVKESEEKVDIELDKKFDMHIYEYTCNVASDIKKIEILQEAYEYNEYVTITGLEEDLKDGENTIIVKLAKDGQKELIYTIKVNKEAKEYTEEVSTEEINAEPEEIVENKGLEVRMPLWAFVILEIALIGISVGVTFFVTKKIIQKNSK